MPISVRLRYRSFLPGAGFNAGGRPKQGKTNTRGRIELTTYVRGGTSLTPVDLGLNNIDDLRLTLVEPVRCPEPTNALRSVVYSYGAEEFYVLENLHDFHQFYLSSIRGVQEGFVGTGNPVRIGELREISAGANFALTFDAFGDSAHDVELT